MSILLPHFLNEGRGTLDVYFSRVYNPIWTNPDGFSWMEALTDESKVKCHVALTPTWSETAWFADYVLPMGVGTERHDVASFETHNGRWIGFRQPVMRRYAEIRGEELGPSPAPTSSTPARSGRRTSSGSTCPGRSTPTAHGAFASGSSPTSVRARRSRSTSTTARCSPTRCPAWPRPPPRPGRPRSSTCATSARSRCPATWSRPTSASWAPTPWPIATRATTGSSASRARSRAWDGTQAGLERDRPRRPRRGFTRGRGRRRDQGGLPDAIEEARALLDHAEGLGLARVRRADVDQEPRPSPGSRHDPRSDGTGQRADPAAHLPDPDADPHPLRQLEVAQRDQPPAPAVDPPLRRRGARRSRRTAWSGSPHASATS